MIFLFNTSIINHKKPLAMKYNFLPDNNKLNIYKLYTDIFFLSTCKNIY